MYFVILTTVFLVIIGIGALWIWALLHCRGNQLLPWTHMEWWLLFIAVTPPIGALIYLYFHRHDPVSLDFRGSHRAATITRHGTQTGQR
jgi:hypothetical protein